MRKRGKTCVAVIGMIAAVMVLGVSSSTADTGTTIFGSSNDGYGDFTTSPTNGTEVWSLEPNSVNYAFGVVGQDEGQIASLLYSNSLDRSEGSAYTIEGVLALTDGYGDDNNRIGIMLFNDTNIQTNDGGGGLYLRLNTDGKNLAIQDGINGENGKTTGLPETDASGAYSQDSWITNAPLTFTGEVTFTNDVINLIFTFTDYDGVEDELYAQVAESNYPGLYFGFATKWRQRGDTNLNRDVPPVIDYSSFSVSVSTNPPDTTAPSAPANLTAEAGDSIVSLNWDDNTEPDLTSYRLFRSTTSGSGYSLIASDLTDSDYVDSGVTNGTTYYYVVSAVDLSFNESAQSAQAMAAPVEIEGTIIFGSLNDGYGGFTENSGLGSSVWSLEPESVRYAFTNVATDVASLLNTFTIDPSVGAEYTIEGQVTLTDGYGDDNNRIGIYLFSPTATQIGDEGGGLWLRLNSDDNGSNIEDLAIKDGGINGTTLASFDVTAGHGDNWIGKTLTFTADLVFTNINTTNLFDATFTLNDGSTVYSCTAEELPTDDYIAGNYFGFASRWRNRGDSGSNRDVPPIFDYKSFLLSGGLPLGGYELWAEDFGGTSTIGAGTDDYDSDGVDNLNEYALDGDPTAPGDIGYVSYLTADGKYIHAQRSDADDITYTIQTTTDLVTGLWGDATPSVVSTNANGKATDVDILTNSVGTVEDEKFIRLLIEQL